MELICKYCEENFYRKKVDKKLKNYFCSRKCSSLYQSKLLSDEYTIFRHMYNRAKGTSKRKNQEFNITLDDIKNVWIRQEGLCNLSGVRLKFGETHHLKCHGASTASLDRTDNTKGYIPDNIQIIHKVLNDLKSDLPEDVFIDWCRKVFKHTADRPIDNPPAIVYTETVDANFVPF